jgi:hypothetical protein
MIAIRTRTEWADRIQNGVEGATASIIQLGRDLIEARADLGPDFYPMVEDDLGRTKRWAQVLMSIGRHEVLTDTKHVSYLPSDTATLYKLSRMAVDDLTPRIGDGRVSPNLSRKDATRMQMEIREAQREDERAVEIAEREPYVPIRMEPREPTAAELVGSVIRAASHQYGNYEALTVPQTFKGWLNLPARDDHTFPGSIEAYEYLRQHHPEMADAIDAFHADLEASYDRWRVFIEAEHEPLKADA